MNMEIFFKEVREKIFAGSMEQSQVDGINTILKACETEKVTDEEVVSYILATGFWESGRKMQPVREIGQGKGRKYGVPGVHNKQIPYGRGLVQITWDRNYEKADKELGLNGELIKNFDLALDPDISARILVRGSIEGWFTNKELVDYLGEDENWVAARAVINGKDKAQTIAEVAMKFNKAFEQAGGWKGKFFNESPARPIPSGPAGITESVMERNRRVSQPKKESAFAKMGWLGGLIAGGAAVLMAPAAASAVDVGEIWSTISPQLAEIALMILTAIAAMVAKWFHTKTGYDIQARHREALHSALVSGVNWAVAQGDTAFKGVKIETGSPMVGAAVDYIVKSVPDALDHFNITEEQLEKMIAGKAQQVLGVTAPSVSPPVGQ